jgi:hypothetical protein
MVEVALGPVNRVEGLLDRHDLDDLRVRVVGMTVFAA